MFKIIEIFIYVILLGPNYKSKIIKNFIKAKRSKKIKNYYLIKKKIIDGVFSYKKNLDHSVNNEKVFHESFKRLCVSKLILNKHFNNILLDNILNQSLFFFPLPNFILHILDKKIQNISYFYSRFLWFILSIIVFFYSLLIILKSNLELSKNYEYSNCNIFLNSIPNIILNKKNNLYLWLINKLPLEKKYISFYHCNKNILNKKIFYNNYVIRTFYISSVTSFFLGKSSFIKNLNTILSLIFKIIFNNKIFNNNIFNKMFLFEELFNYYLLNINKYSFDYILFNNPSIVFKPLWVKLNERLIKNSVIFYFYSINIFPLQEKNQKRYFDVNGYALSEWNLFWIWNKGQLNWLRKKVNKVFKYKYIRYLPFEGQYYQQNYKNKKIVTIFDVPPKNLFTKSQLVNSYNHYSFNFCSRFLNDILEVLKNKNIIIIIKIKRDYQNIDLRYKNLILKLKKIKNIKLFYDEISAECLVENSNLTISSPFTSTALISKRLNKKTIYYNPYLEIHKTGYNPLNIKIISKLENLKTWIDKNL